MANINIVHTETHDESKPAGSRARSLGDDDIREKDRAIRERLAVDHVSPADESGETGVGTHKQVTMKTSAADPTTYADVGYVYLKTVSGTIEQFYKDSAGNVTQQTSGGKTRAESIGGVYPAADAAAVASILSRILPSIYPIGVVITLGVSTNPATLFGFGTWTAIAGKVIVGINAGDAEFDTLDETGGEKTHTLITAEMPAHVHAIDESKRGGYANNNEFYTVATGGSSPTTFNSDSAGGDGAHNNLQPYIVKYVWQRTA